MSNRARAVLILVLLVAPILAYAADPISLFERPRSWKSTGDQNSLIEEEGIFYFLGRPSNRALRTGNTETNIHSHYSASGSRGLANYTYTGRMRLLEDGGGVGVTFYSKYPAADRYYRLRRYAGEPTFHIAPHGTELSGGNPDSGVNPTAGAWYKFKIVVTNRRDRTRIRAKVWQSGTREPRGFQIDCYDATPTRIRAGKPGVWAMADGSKEWRDLRVKLPE